MAEIVGWISWVIYLPITLLLLLLWGRCTGRKGKEAVTKFTLPLWIYCIVIYAILYFTGIGAR